MCRRSRIELCQRATAEIEKLLAQCGESEAVFEMVRDKLGDGEQHARR